MILLRLLLTRQFRDRFPSSFLWLVEVISALFTVAIYYFTAKAITAAGAKTEFFAGVSYFEYVLLGELLLALPQACLLLPARELRNSVIEGTLDIYRLAPRSLPRIFAELAFAALLTEAVFALLTLAIAVLCFGFPLSLGLVAGLLFVLPTLPIFFALGILGATIFLRFGRGSGWIPQLSFVLAILSGVYFPIAVLPEILRGPVEALSPFAWLLDWGRALGRGELHVLGAREFGQIIGVCFLGLGLLCLSAWIFAREDGRQRRSGKATLPYAS